VSSAPLVGELNRSQSLPAAPIVITVEPVHGGGDEQAPSSALDYKLVSAAAETAKTDFELVSAHDALGRLIMGRSARAASPHSAELAPLWAEVVQAGTGINMAGARYLVVVDATRMRLHPIHSRLCATVTADGGERRRAMPASQATSCLSPTATQLFWASSHAHGDRGATAFNLERIPTSAFVVTVTLMDVRGRTHQASFPVEGTGALGDAASADVPTVESAVAISSAW
jgi:hypothetical protein